MAESGGVQGRISFRNPQTGRFISAREAAESGGFVESFAPDDGPGMRAQLSVPGPGDPFTRADNPNSTLITRTEEAEDDWLKYVEPPIDRDVTEFRFVVADDSYASGFRTSVPFSADESPYDVAERLGILDLVVRVVYGVRE